MLNYQEYIKLYPNSKAGECKDNSPYYKLIEYGFLLFNDESAHHWAGPWEGNYAGVRVQDWTTGIPPYPKDKGKTLLQAREEQFMVAKSKHDREELAKANRLKSLNNETYIPKEYSSLESQGDATLANPIRIYMFGNDDTSYSKAYPSIELATEDLKLLESMQPLAFQDIIDLNFVFTN